MAIYFAPADACDSGVYPSIAANNYGTVVEVHSAQSMSTGLWCRVGGAGKIGKFEWEKSQKYGFGHYPSVAINDSGFSVEVDESSFGTLCYRAGKVTGKTIEWGESHQYGRGNYPVVALRDDETVVAAHSSGSTVYCVVGTLNTRTKTIDWSPVNVLGSGEGYYPSIAMNKDGVVVEMDNYGSVIQYRVGKLNPADKPTSIRWGNCHKFEREVGWYPSVSLSNNDTVIEVHQASNRMNRNVYSRIGRVNPEAKTIEWDESCKYDTGRNPTVAIIDDNRIYEEHGTSSDFRSDLWCRLGKLESM